MVASLLPDTFAIMVTDFCYNCHVNIKTMLPNAQLYCKPTLSNVLQGFVASPVEKSAADARDQQTYFSLNQG